MLQVDPSCTNASLRRSVAFGASPQTRRKEVKPRVSHQPRGFLWERIPGNSILQNSNARMAIRFLCKPNGGYGEGCAPD